MTCTRPLASDGTPAWRGAAWWPAVLIMLAGLAAYANSFTAPFVLDDLTQIVENPAVHGWRGGLQLLHLQARPVTLLSLRASYFLDRLLGGSGVRPPVYHAMNVVFHVCAALILYAVVRRAHARSPQAPGNSIGVAAAVAALWVVHPLTTQAVTYTIQRGEVLAGVFTLLTLYAFMRGAQVRGAKAWGWYTAAGVACWLGFLSKQVAVVAPLVVLLYDRAFLSQSWVETLRVRWGVYLILLTPLVVVVWVAMFSASLLPASPYASAAQASAGFALEKHTAAQYLMTQPRVVLHYLRLAVAPHPLVFDYGWSAVSDLSEAWPWFVAIIPLLVATLIAVWRWPRVGFVAAAFFILLAPSSSFLPIADVIFEYRMYLPLVCVLTLAVLAAAWLLDNAGGGQTARAAIMATAAAGVGLGGLTLLRNRDYSSGERLWLDTTLKAPANARAHHSLANVYLLQGRFEEALPAFQRAIELEPRNALVRTNYAVALRETGQPDAARAQLIKALQFYAGFPEAMYQMSVTAREMGDTQESEHWLLRALETRPQLAAAWLDLGVLHYERGRAGDAILAWERAASLGMRSSRLFNNLGLAYAQTGKLDAAALWWGRSLDVSPSQPDIGDNLKRINEMREGASR